MAPAAATLHDRRMATMLPLDKLNDAIAREAFVPDVPPLCPCCNVTMSRGEVRAPRRPDGPAGAKAIVVLPTWTCGRCGRHQPRLTL